MSWVPCSASRPTGQFSENAMPELCRIVSMKVKGEFSTLASITSFTYSSNKLKTRHTWFIEAGQVLDDYKISFPNCFSNNPVKRLLKNNNNHCLSDVCSCNQLSAADSLLIECNISTPKRPPCLFEHYCIISRNA